MRKEFEAEARSEAERSGWDAAHAVAPRSGAHTPAHASGNGHGADQGGVDPGGSHPIAARIAAYTEGDAKLRALQEAGEIHRAKKSRLERIEAGVARLFDEESALRLSAPESPAHQAARKELEEYRLAYHDAAHFEKKFREQSRARAMTILGADTPMRFEAEHRAPGVTSREPTAAELEGLRFLSSVVSGKDAEAVKFFFRSLDTDGRAFQVGDGVFVTPDDTASTVAHEMGHLLEHKIPSWGRAAREFLEYRTAGEAASRLRDVSDRGYGADEVGKRDRFADAFGENDYYVGKQYPRATEITSMAVEKLMDDPSGFATQDPEFCKFILGLLDGSLR
jgi:hypothetical protein